jgi:hypothetical protein
MIVCPPASEDDEGTTASSAPVRKKLLEAALPALGCTSGTIDRLGDRFAAPDSRAGRSLDAQPYPASHHLQHLDDHILADDDLFTDFAR